VDGPRFHNQLTIENGDRALKIKGPGSKGELLRGQIALIKAVRENAENGKPLMIGKSRIRKLLKELRYKNPKAYHKARHLSIPVQRKLFILPIFAALGLGSLGTALAPMISGALGLSGTTGALAGAGIVTGGALAAGAAIAGALNSGENQNDKLARLKVDQMDLQGEVAMTKAQLKDARSKLDYKMIDIDSQVADLIEAINSHALILNMWVDSRSLI
jgi:hypothetical protein